VYAFSRRLTRATGARIYDLVLETLAREVQAQTAAFALYDETENALAIVATRGYPLAIVEHLRIRPGAGVIGQAFATGRATVSRGDSATTARRLRYRTASYLAVPFSTVGRPVSVVTLTDPTGLRDFTRADLQAVRLLAAPAALALARERITANLHEISRAATIDPVTGLFNRRHFETRLQAELQRARRQQEDLALLMVDIDDFKRINDTFGHLEGDRALREVADLLRGGVRIFDLCARYGGEEFAIVMPATPRSIAIQVAERIRHRIHEYTRFDPFPITVSIGVGLLRSDDSPDDLVNAADRALIEAKGAGKNTVKSDHRQ
jgi:diguanylate cyclase (GGDEF)-like protein